MRTDPTNTGGLFIGPRPGLAKTHYDPIDGPPPGRRWMLDRLLAHVALVVMLVGCLSLWAPLPAAAMWMASHVTQTATLWVGLALATTCVFVFVGLALLRRVDQLWLLCRRASGLDQREGALNRCFALGAVIAVPCAFVWFFFLGGFAPMLSNGA